MERRLTGTVWEWISQHMCTSGHLRTIHKGFRGVLPPAAVLALLCASLTAFANTVLAQQGTFVATRSLNTPRTGHTSTYLNNGKVLIVGGQSGDSTTILASAELCDPLAGSFTARACLLPGERLKTPRVSFPW